MINVFDIETYNDEGKIISYCIAFNINMSYKVYYEMDSNLLFKKFFDYIFNQPEKNIIFFVHNLTFDGCLLLEYVSTDSQIKYETIVKNNNLYYLKLHWKDYIISFKCSYKFLPTSLHNIAIGLNLPYKKMPYPYSGITKTVLLNNLYIPNLEHFNDLNTYKHFLELYKNHTIMSYTKEYCLTDIKLTKSFVEIINILCKTENISILTEKIYSAPGLALKIFTKNYNTKKISLVYNALFDNYIRSAYYGGRCEVFGNPVDLEHLYHFDFSGMYGWCLEQKFPFGAFNFKTKDLDINQPGYYYIEYTSNMEIPILPHHNPLNGKLMFTNGFNRGIFWFEEIQLFLEEGGIIHDIKSGIVFEKYDYCFKEFVQHFNEIRKKGGAYKLFAKLNINSLYGKLGNKRYEHQTSLLNYENYLNLLKQGIEISDVTNINKLFIVTHKISQKRHNNQAFGIQFAAAITAKARVRLYKTLKEIQKAGGRILYCDTDSYFVEYKQNVLGQTHGEAFWDPTKSDTVITDAVFAAPKMYGVCYKNSEMVKFKGIENKKINFKDFKKAFYSSQEILEFNENYFHKKNLQLSFKKHQKMIRLNSYDKRKFSKDKKSTTPYELKNGVYI